MCKQNPSYLVKYSEFGSKNLNKVCSKSTKIAITACNISKFLGKAYLRTPLKPFMFFNLLQLALLKKTTLEKNDEIMPPPPPLLKFLATPLHRPMNNKYHIPTTLSCYLGSEFRQNCRQKHPPSKIFLLRTLLSKIKYIILS